jgi:putative inorganic carbon (HCO3(-)) transporter
MSMELARAAALIACAGLALLVLATRRELRLGGLAAWAVGLAALSLYLAPDGTSAAKLALAAAAIVAASALGAVVLLRWPWALAFATLLCLPLRIPLELGGEDGNLLVPLYLVVGSLALALGWQLFWNGGPGRELGRLGWPLALFLLWTGASILWTDDVRQAAIFLAAFMLPFGLLAVGFARLPWRPAVLPWLYGLLTAMAVAFALLGLYQWATRDVFWNPKVIVGNAYAPFYRVNSVFWDPSIYGRFLVVAIVATLVLVLTGARGRTLWAACGLAVVMWVGLLFSFSQSSFAALIAAVVVAAALVWRWRAAAALAIAALVLVAVGFGTPKLRENLVDKSRAGLNAATSGRANLVGQGIRIAGDHPLLGVGVGSFKRAYAERTGLRGQDPQKAASHSTPVTVAAETGLPGLLLFVWLVGAALVGPLRRVGASVSSRTALAAGLTLGAIVVHSCFYNALFEDPTTWALAGLAVVAVRAREADRQQ